MKKNRLKKSEYIHVPRLKINKGQHWTFNSLIRDHIDLKTRISFVKWSKICGQYYNIPCLIFQECYIYYSWLPSLLLVLVRYPSTYLGTLYTAEEIDFVFKMGLVIIYLNFKPVFYIHFSAPFYLLFFNFGIDEMFGMGICAWVLLILFYICFIYYTFKPEPSIQEAEVLSYDLEN